jgi:hypothetical protein
MPLDDRVPNPNHVTNRAIMIHAAPEAIWPWLVQMGELPRGGFYSYVTVERMLRMKVENAEAILPQFQNLRVGDALDRSGGLVVQAIEPSRHLVLGPAPGRNLRVTWALALYPAPDGTTRLVSRCRAWMRPGIERLAWRVILDAGQLLMERRMLLEIRRRAERPPDTAPATEDRRSTVA